MSMRTQVESAHQANRTTELLLNLYRCGIAGWCLEVTFTPVGPIMTGDQRLMGHISLVIFLIYGMGALLSLISRLIDNWLAGLSGFEDVRADRIFRLTQAVRHGLIHMALIFIVKYITGVWFTNPGICSWDYSLWPGNVGRVIRLEFAPLWFGTGLLFEYLIRKKSGY